MKSYSLIAVLLILCFTIPAQAETYVFITKSAVAASGKMLEIAEEPYAADKMRTSTLSLVPDKDGKWLVQVWVDTPGKQAAIEAHGYPILEEWIEELE